MGDISSILCYNILGEVMKTIAFFGHRQIIDKTLIQEKIMKILLELGVKEKLNVLIGCHGCFDKIALSTCLKYKKESDNIKINIVLTSITFLCKDKFGESKADFYENKGCRTLFYDIENVYYKNRITYSNKKMVDESDLIICYANMKNYKSGAKTAVNYAKKQNKKIINLFEK